MTTFRFRPQRGGLEESMKEVKTFDSKLELAKHLGVCYFSVEAEAYGYDPRIEWNTWIVLVDGQAVGFTDGGIE